MRFPQVSVGRTLGSSPSRLHGSPRRPHLARDDVRDTWHEWRCASLLAYFMVVLVSVVLSVEPWPSPPRSSRLVPSQDFEYWCLRDTTMSALGTAQRPLGIAHAAPARQNMEEAAVGDNPGRVPSRPANWDQMTRAAPTTADSSPASPRRVRQRLKPGLGLERRKHAAKARKKHKLAAKIMASGTWFCGGPLGKLNVDSSADSLSN